MYFVNSGTKYHVQNGFNGRVIVERYGLNGTICEEGWSDVDANILCKQSGFAGGVAFGTPRNSSFELVWYSDVNCTGGEASIAYCVKNDTVSRSCRNSATSAGALCYKSTGKCMERSSALLCVYGGQVDPELCPFVIQR